ncbi:autotransporter outer membrane beta-barrel domain-containing protein [Terasakiella sp.]|uniref:autotransporter outer membrane beta-barrel domain-containing protein n=1 Tax=Terasakiella sp. TaxID=2034861 RepID=UPI003AA7D12E
MELTMFSKCKILIAGAAVALVSTQASAETYSSGPNAAGSSVVAPVVAKSIAVANVNNVSAHLDAIVGVISGAVGGGGVSVTPTPTTKFEGGNTKQTVSLFDSAKQHGYGAGNETRKVSVWANLSYTWIESDKANENFDGNVGALNVGIDKWFTDKLMAGVSIGYASTDVDTTFNSGTYEEKSTTLAPYALIRITDNVNLTGMFGHTWGDVDQDRQNGATTASTDAKTWFAATTLSASKQIKNIGLTGRVGYLWSDRDTDGFVESNGNVVAASQSKTSQGRIGAEASYAINSGKLNLTPFASVDYLRDFKDEINDDADAFDLGLGLRVGSKDGSVDGSLNVKTQVGRDNFESTTASATVRFKF